MPASFGGAKELVRRVRLAATDFDLSIGQGPEISGPALALLLAVTGRRVILDELGGPGLAILTEAIRHQRGARKSPRGEPGAFS
jgi:hypothetical protein